MSDSAIGQDCALQQAPTILTRIEKVVVSDSIWAFANVSHSAIGQDCARQQAPTFVIRVDGVSGLLTKLSVG